MDVLRVLTGQQICQALKQHLGIGIIYVRSFEGDFQRGPQS